MQKWTALLDSRLFRLALPFLLWLFLFRSFFLHQNTVNLDTLLHYGVVKFFMNNIMNGVLPLWEPYTHLGSPFYALAMLGFFNPLIYLIALLVSFGMNYYDAFLVQTVLFYWLGCAGFYQLARAFLKNEAVAFLAYTALLFSGMGASVFVQANLLLIFTPSMWFFYFLLRFVRSFQRKHFLGLTFCSMVLMTSYLPFHFFTCLCVVAILSGFIYWNYLGRLLKGALAFIGKNWLLVLVCLGGILVSASPLVLQKMADNSSEIVSPARHCNYTTAEECLGDTLGNDSRMKHVDIVQSGALDERVSFERLFSHLDKMTFGTDGIPYVPTVCYFLILCGALVRVNRRNSLLFLATMALGLIALGKASPVHKFFYDHVFYFQYFRNLFYFMAFLTPLLILLAAEQLCCLQAEFLKGQRNRLVIAIGAGSLALFFGGLLFSQGNILWTTWAALSGTVVFAVLLAVFPAFRQRADLFVLVCPVLLLLEPVQALTAYDRNARIYSCQLPSQHVKPEFSYTRKDRPVETGCRAEKFLGTVPDFWHQMIMSDTDGKIGMPGTVGRGVFLLSGYVEPSALTRYVQHKFLLYTHVERIEPTLEGMGKAVYSVRTGVNAVFLSNADDAVLKAFASEPAIGQAMTVQGPTGTLRVTRFGVNGLFMVTNFPRDILLVYTESYEPSWRLFINGQRRKLYKANLGFKGIWLPAGNNYVELRYEPPGGTLVYVLTTMTMFAFAVVLIRVLVRRRRS